MISGIHRKCEQKREGRLQLMFCCSARVDTGALDVAGRREW